METSAGLRLWHTATFPGRTRFCYFNFFFKVIYVWLKLFHSLIFFPFYSFFLAEALYPLSSKAKLGNAWNNICHHPGQRYNWKWEEFFSSRQLTFVQIPNVWDRGRGRVYLWLSPWERCAHSHKRELIFSLKMAYGGVGGWEQKKGIAVSIFDIFIHLLQQLSFCQFDPDLFSFEVNSISIYWVLTVCCGDHFKRRDLAFFPIICTSSLHLTASQIS